VNERLECIAVEADLLIIAAVTSCKAKPDRRDAKERPSGRPFAADRLG
jgi:hypothetical protein